jgi:hypothetical protein
MSLGARVEVLWETGVEFVRWSTDGCRADEMGWCIIVLSMGVGFRVEGLGFMRWSGAEHTCLVTSVTA